MNEIKVDQFEYRTARAPNELYSGGLGPCIAMGAIYGRKGYMFHAHPVGYDFSSYIEPIFRDLRKDVKDKSKLRIWVVGGRVDKKSTEEKKTGRQTVLDKIVKNGFKECIKKIQWCQLDYAQTLRLILSEGRAEIEEDSMEDLINNY